VFLELASGENMESWGQVAIDYESGILLLLKPARQALIDDPEKELQSLLEGFGPGAELGTISGRPAILIPSTPEDPTDGAEIVMAISDVFVLVYARYAPIDLDALSEVAATIQ
jgi:hypothetical protein